MHECMISFVAAACRSRSPPLARRAARRLRVDRRRHRQADRLQVDVVARPALELPPDLTHAPLRRPLQRDHRVGPRRRRAPTGRRAKRSAADATPDAQDRARRQRALARRQGDARAGVEHDAQVLEGHRLRARGRAAARSASWKPTGRKTAPSMPTRTSCGARSASRRRLLHHATSATSSARASSAAPSPARSRSTSRTAAMEQVPTAQDRQPLAGRVRLGGDAAGSRPRSRDADAADDAFRRARRRPRRAAVQPSTAPTPRPERARLDKSADGSLQARRRRRLRPRVAPRRPGARPRRASPSSTATARSGIVLRPLRRSRRDVREEGRQGWLDKLSSGSPTRRTGPSSTGSTSRKPTPRSVVTRAGPERRARQDARPARRSSRCCGTSSSSGATRACASPPSAAAAKATASSSRRAAPAILIDCGFGVRDTATRLARLGLAPDVARPRFSSRTSTPITSAACRRSRRATTFRSGDVRHAGGGRRALRGHARTSTASTATTVRDRRRSRSSRSRCRTTRASRCSSCRRRRAPPRRADRHRHVDAATSRRACPAATRWCSNATTISTLLANGDYPRSLKQRIAGRFGHLHNEAAAQLLARIDTTRLAAHHRRAPVAAEQHARAGARRARRRAGLRGRLDRHRRPGRRASTGATMSATGRSRWKSAQELYKGKAKTVYATDDPHHLVMHYRDDVSAFDGVKLAKLDAEGRDQQQDQRLRDGQARRGRRRRRTSCALLNERESLVKAMKMIPVECVVRNVCAGSMAKRYGIDEGTRLPEPIFEFFLKSDALHDPLCNDDHIRVLGWASADGDRADEGADAQGQRGAEAALRRRRHRPRRLQARVRPPDRTIPTGRSCSATNSRRTAAGCGTRRPARSSTRTASAATSAA